MIARSWTLLAALALGACTTVATTPSANPPALVPGMVSAADPRAAEAGAEILRQGGSATDAALATLLALNVVEPQSSGIGGGGFLVHSDAGGAVDTFDGREEAPMAATPTWFYADGKPLPIEQAIPGGRSVGVPGNVRMMALAHARHGKLPWKALFGPAIRLAGEGYILSPRGRRMLAGDAETGALTAEGRAIYYLPDGSPKPVGTRITNPAFARFLTQLSEQGPDSFYVGPNAQAIAAAVAGAPRNAAPMTVGDIAAYDAKQRAPVCGTYRSYRICGMGPPSSGATTVFAILKQLERFDLKALGKDNPASWHLFIESMRLAYADRARYLGDADFVRVPVAGLTDAQYLGQRSALISADATMASVSAGTPAGAPQLASAAEQAEHGTSHFVAADAAGNVASLTSTIESSYGSGLMVNGYYLNNELTDFNIVPDKDGAPTANRVEAGKRPRSSMSPTIVFAPDGKVRLAIGAAGGSTIIAQVAKAIVGVIDWNLPAQDAIALPLVYAPGGTTVYIERGNALDAITPGLRALGHSDIQVGDLYLKANALEWKNGHWVGAADPRSEGAAVQQ
ncbi:gamma-glutamyltransferase [Sphingomonas sp. RB56-2]|uniref:Glutathione hydrolase proenzyme n=1 Tax=Sphingomonas brevis TaxID=2908206 RepID=A0ABT0SAH8_9SPHN|nr:gamma-glutamyltransferase [Sphingomonas brevis]MCL6741357.1 gamma-glutamyltransferase [Sphingomonas brevis]